MRVIGTGNSAQPTSTKTDFTDAVRIEVTNASDVLVDLSAYAVSVEYDSSADEIVDAATVVFRRLEGASSLAPLMTASPPVDLGRRIVVSINPGSGTYKEVFRGKITDVDWPERFGDVTCQCLDQARDASRTWIEKERAYGSTTGVSLETVMQAVATDNMTSPPTLYFPVATSAVVQHVEGDPPYGPTEQSVLDAERALAESYGGTIRWRNFDATADDWRWTVFTPSRTKTVPDHTFGTSDYFDVKQIKLSDADIRNVIEVEYSEGGVRKSVTVSDATSITAYGRLYGKISEGSDSPVNTAAKATELANAALSDLKEPDVLLEISCRYFWPGEIGVDLYRFTANNVHFVNDQDLAAMQFRHRIAVGESPTTHIAVRGKPSGGVLSWRGRVKGGTGTLAPGDAADITGWIIEETTHAVGTASQGYSEEQRIRSGSGGYSAPGARIHAEPIYDSIGATPLLDTGTMRITADLKYPGGTGIDALRPAEAGAEVTTGKSLTILADRTAANINYIAGGAPTLEDLKPAEVGANVTETRTSADTAAVDGTAAATVKGGAVRANTGLDATGLVALDVPRAKAVANVPGIDVTSGTVDKGTAFDTGELQAGLRDTSRAAGTATQGWSEEGRLRSGSGGYSAPSARIHAEPIYDSTGATPLLDPSAQTFTGKKLIGGGATPSVAIGSLLSTSNVGTGYTISVAGTDTAGKVTLVTGTGISADITADQYIWELTFGAAFAVAPYGVVNPANPAAGYNGGTASIICGFNSTTTIGGAFALKSSVTLTNSTTYIWTYLVIG